MRAEFVGANIRAIFSAEPIKAPVAVVANLIGSNTVVCAGQTTVSTTPILALCRELIAEGFAPETPLMAYRDGTLAIAVRSIGEAAKLEIGARGDAFIKKSERRGAPYVRQNGEAARVAPRLSGAAL